MGVLMDRFHAFCLLLFIMSTSRGGLKLAMAAYAPDLVSSLPGQPAPVSFQQYAGYITINATAGRHFFYYFVEAQQSPESSPLTLWLNGGPGCSSLGYGAFSELGPFFPSGDKLIANPYAWNKYSNVLFVESPASVGFSYSNTSSDFQGRADDYTTADDNLVFLLNWLEKFPEYKGRSLYISGESYAGHYVPQLAHNVLTFMKSNGSSLLNLKAIAIGNPLLDDEEDSKSAVTFLWTHGLNSYQTAEAMTKYCNWTADTFSQACIAAFNESDNEVGSSINYYDVILDVCLEAPVKQLINRRLRKQLDASSPNNFEPDVCISNEVTTYFNRPDVQAAIHANMSQPWSLCSSVLKYNFTTSPTTMLPVLEDILNDGARILVYSGDQDSVLPLIGTGILAHKLAKYMGLNASDPYRSWFQGQQVGGWTVGYGEGGKLTFATVRGAAHFVPGTQGARALTLFQSFIKSQPLPPSQTSMS